jgi:hypothetical protein
MTIMQVFLYLAIYIYVYIYIYLYISYGEISILLKFLLFVFLL